LNVEPIVSPLVGTLEEDTRLEEEATPSKLSGETPSETDTVRREIPIEVDRRIGVDTPVTIAQDGEGGGLPPMPPIDPLVRPRGLPILVPQNLAAVDMPSHLPKFYGTKDEDPSRHMERYIERLASSLVTNPGYWLVWFPTTLEGEAYEWYRDHAEGHFIGWEQMQREFLNELGQRLVRARLLER
jgi:hypothetical protein